MWIFKQSTGELFKSGDPKPIAVGYSGHEQGKNNPVLQTVRDLGPIPEGFWTFAALIEDGGRLGKNILHIIAKVGTATFGRSGFFMHGENPEHPGMSSDGCLIFPMAIRLRIWESGDHDLQVIA